MAVISRDKKIIAGNWKLNKSPKETQSFIEEFAKIAQATKDFQKISDLCRFVICPQASSWESFQRTVKALSTSNSPGGVLELGAQNCFVEAQGAFTGENSYLVLKELSGQWVLVGHSERRTLFRETDEFLCRKVDSFQKANLIPILCIGETLGEREGEQTEEVLQHQLRDGLKNASEDLPLVVAYEPVWAIGTGKVATVNQVAHAHKFIANELIKLGFADTPILYGGSVKADNSKELGNIPYVDGFLIGGASLQVTSYLGIAQSLI